MSSTSDLSELSTDFRFTSKISDVTSIRVGENGSESITSDIEPILFCEFFSGLASECFDCDLFLDCVSSTSASNKIVDGNLSELSTDFRFTSKISDDNLFNGIILDLVDFVPDFGFGNDKVFGGHFLIISPR